MELDVFVKFGWVCGKFDWVFVMFDSIAQRFFQNGRSSWGRKSAFIPLLIQREAQLTSLESRVPLSYAWKNEGQVRLDLHGREHVVLPISSRVRECKSHNDTTRAATHSPSLTEGTILLIVSSHPAALPTGGNGSSSK